MLCLQRRWLHWVTATGLKLLCRGNPMLSLARTQKDRCHVVAGGHQEPDILLCFFWMSSAHGVKEEGGNIFYSSKLLLPHTHNQNSWRLYVLLKPNCSKNTKHRGNTKGRLSKRGRKDGTKHKERAPILYLMCSKLYSIYIFIIYYPPQRANKKNLVTQKEENKIYTLYCICHGASNMFIC